MGIFVYPPRPWYTRYMPPLLRTILIVVVCIFAGIGLLFTGVFVAMQFGLLNVRGVNSERNAFFLNTSTSTLPATVTQVEPCLQGVRTCTWSETREWAVVAGGLTKDQAVIARVAQETGVSARLIAAAVVPEQIRFFTAEREVFKRYFEPLKILGSLSQFSLGVSGIKQETARMIERNAINPQSPFYTGEADAALLVYTAQVSNKDAELYNRLTDDKNHYYSYLYTALFLKQIMTQWERAGFSLADKPDIVITLFNIGFTRSSPHANPEVGGAPITVGGTTYAFGELGGAFFVSEELRDVFAN